MTDRCEDAAGRLARATGPARRPLPAAPCRDRVSVGRGAEVRQRPSREQGRADGLLRPVRALPLAVAARDPPRLRAVWQPIASRAADRLRAREFPCHRGSAALGGASAGGEHDGADHRPRRHPVRQLRHRLRGAERDEHRLEYPTRPLAELLETIRPHPRGDRPARSRGGLLYRARRLRYRCRPRSGGIGARRRRLRPGQPRALPARVHGAHGGAIAAPVFWETLQLIGTWYVTRGLRNASPTYGVFAVVITLLSWLYLGSQLTLWAAEITVGLRS